MEENLMDELYGDLDDHPSGMYLHQDEDSVDIYSGLENSPKGNGNKRKVNHFLSPRTIESMDMYEDIIREEEEEKEATYNELKQKFEAAQIQVKELLSNLQLLQTKNSSLSNENTLLKKNICSLIKTARMEIVRKDEEISRLSNRSGRGSYGQNFRRPQMESGQANTRHSLNNASCSILDCRQDNVTNEVNKHKDKNSVLGLATASAVTPQPFEVLQRCPRSDLENPQNRQNKNSAARSDSEIIHPEQDYGHVQRNRTSGSVKHPTTSKVAGVSDFPQTCNAGLTASDSDISTLKDNKNCPLKRVDLLDKPPKHTSCDKECNLQNKDASKKSQKRAEDNLCKSGRNERELIKENFVSSETTNHPPQVPVILRTSGRSKSASSLSHKALPSDVSSQSSKSSVKTARDMETQEHNQDTDRTSKETRPSGWRSTTCSVVDEASHSQNNKVEKRDLQSGQQRKEDKGQETASSAERRSTRTEKHREHEQKRPKETGRSKRDESHSRSRGRSSNRSDSSKEYERRNAMEADNKDDDKRCRSRKQVDALDNKQASFSSKCDSHGKEACKEKASGRIDEPLLKSKKSHSHDSSRKIKGFRSPGKKAGSNKYFATEKGKHKERERKTGSGYEEHMVQKDGKSKNLVLNKDGQNDSFPKKHRIIREGQQCKNHQNKHLDSVHTESSSTIDVSSNLCKTAEDSSPDRKLSFMETLNLTLSPLKKQRSSTDSKEPVGETSEDASADNRSISELGEDFFVIDELQNSQESAEEIDEEPEPTTTVKQHDPISSCKQSGLVEDLLTVVTSEKTLAEETDMEVQKENVIKIQEAVDEFPAIITIPEKKIGKLSDRDDLPKDCLSILNLARDSQTNICTKDSPEDNLVVSNRLPTNISELTVSDNIPKSVVDDCQIQDPFTTVSEETFKIGIQSNLKPNSHNLLPSQNGICQENVSSSDKACSIPKSNSSGNSESSVTVEVSSSTITIDLNEQSKAEVSTSQDIKRASHTFENLKHVEITQTSENLKTAEKSHQILLCGQNTTVLRDSTTVREEPVSSVQVGFSEPDSTEKDEQILKSSSSDVFCHDEDSMMLTLRNIKVIPEAISPLTSPVRQVKKVQPHRSDKQPHVKSLSKDLSATTSDKINIDMNKENKSPDSSITSASQKGVKDALLVSETEEDELEDGEIVSESEEEGPLFIQTPPREKDKSTSGTHSSPKLSSVGKRVPQKKACIPVKYSKHSKSSVNAASNGSPTSSKRRFKTVSLPLKSAVNTSGEFMDMLATIRVELRRKYMKLHKNVTKTAFCCIVDMSHASFTEFVNSVDLDKLCYKGNNIKVEINNIISSIMSKVTKNGIVNRIFDQKAGDLKQKLWTFMDGQIDFLFKELKATLKSGSESSMDACSTEDKNTTHKEKEIDSKVVEKEPFRTSVHRAKKAKVGTGNCAKEALTNHLPPRGLGSRGKNIKAVMKEDDEQTQVNMSQQIPTSSSEKSVHESTSGSPNKISSYARRLSSNASIQDKSDFEILTEQQASSLTFNLVSDSQMGEIFKCLLQGSDLLEPSLPVGDNQCWPVSTPRKEGFSGESLIGIMTPNKTTPSKFITSWSSISPYKFASSSKILDPAILDESCLLEVPSSSVPCQVPVQSAVISQRSFSILAEDLAVSLTVPSPLKSDSHLSFLNPGTGQPLSAPNSILSAHYSEDALDGEDATEQDIHLSLDTDNSSCGSSPSRTWEGSDPPGFQFKPNLPMQAVVMERSNDHFIVRIRHTSTGPIESDQNEEKTEPALNAVQEPLPLNPKLSTSPKHLGPAPAEISCKSQTKATAEQEPLPFNPKLSKSPKHLDPAPAEISDKSQTKAAETCHVLDHGIHAQPSIQMSPSTDVGDVSSFSLPNNKAKQVSKEANEESSSAEIKTAVERVSRKRKEHHSEPKAKRSKKEKSQDKHHKSRHKRRSKSPKGKSSKAEVSQVSPSSLSAKNVIRKKGEVVVAWTRDEDRDILVELKMKGASPKTFDALSKRLKKSTEQIEERFTQLLKLFKKKEKMDN